MHAYESDTSDVGVTALVSPSHRACIKTVFAQGSGSPRLQALVYANRVTTLLPPDDATDDGDVLYVGRRSPPIPALAFNIVATPENPEVCVLNRQIPSPVKAYARVFGSAAWSYDTPARERASARQSRLDYTIRPTASSLAGEENVSRLVRDIQATILDAKSTDKIILYGVSRGASSLIIAVTRLTEYERGRISLLVAEAPFDTVFNVVKSRWGWVVAHVAQLAMGCCTTDSPWSDETPIDAVSNFPHEVPLLIFSGARDQVCPIEAQRALVERVRECGHEKTTHVVLPNSTHVNMARGPDATLYWNAMQDAYNRMFSVSDLR